mmetsp:Transcript_3781/g.6456  ORF Transcript_3781/g.6456 Transcript_3781/m.6456 type:complete len:81 (+) Transcript_3781:67-309(+)
MQAQQMKEMKKQLEEFRQNLEEFAVRNKKEINDNPVFRSQFLAMCREIGVDPLSSHKKSDGAIKKVFSDKINDFYYELAI